MPWTKSTATLGDGMQMVRGRTQQVQSQVVPSYTFQCPCGTTTTVLVTNDKKPVKVWCCGSWHEPEQPQRESFLTRLFPSSS